MSSRILLIDDNTDFTGSISDLLILNDYEVDVAENGSEALKKIWMKSYDLLLLDINMPTMNGKAFIEELQRQNYELPVIVISGVDVNELKNYFFEKGAISFLKKPFSNQTLISLIENTLRFTKKIIINSEKKKPGFGIETFVPDYESLSLGDQDFINQLLKHINEYMLSNQFSVKFIADKMGYSSRQFNRKIKKFFDRTAHDLLSEFRFKMIHTLIRMNNMSLQEVSEKMGFSSTSYFKKLYSKYVNDE